MQARQVGRLPAKYSFALNPDANARFSRCPKCQKLTYLRKFALLIHVEGADLTVLGKTCRYCPKCELIIAHQNELEGELVHSFSARKLEVVGNPYLVIGTLDRKTWKRGLQSPLTLDPALDQAADFKRYLEVWEEPGGWVPNKRKL